MPANSRSFLTVTELYECRDGLQVGGFRVSDMVDEVRIRNADSPLLRYMLEGHANGGDWKTAYGTLRQAPPESMAWAENLYTAWLAESDEDWPLAKSHYRSFLEKRPGSSYWHARAHACLERPLHGGDPKLWLAWAEWAVRSLKFLPDEHPWASVELRESIASVTNKNIEALWPKALDIGPGATEVPSSSSLEISRRSVCRVETALRLDGTRATGTAFLIRDRLAVTAAHVVKGAQTCELYGPRGDRVRADVVAVRHDWDLALLRLAQPIISARPLPLRTDSRADVGDRLFVVGSPAGAEGSTLDGTVTSGVVSAYREIAGVLHIQTDAPINPGNSGGPILDANGRVVAVAVSKVRDRESLNFGVSARYIQSLLDLR